MHCDLGFFQHAERFFVAVAREECAFDGGKESA
jgi:hypothetical protein